MTSRDLTSAPAGINRHVLSLGRWFYRKRGWTPVPFVLALLILGEPTPASLLRGGLLLVLGEVVRLWSVAYSGPDTRRFEVMADTLATGGPYAVMRNPIYAGNLLMYTGTVLMANVPLVAWLIITWLFFGAQYWLIIQVEERVLESRFGSTYRAYCRRVPAYHPRIPSLDEWSASPPAWPGALQSETSTWASAVVVVGAMMAKMVLTG